MKKIILTSILIGFVAVTNAQIKGGLHGTFNSIKDFGIGANAEYMLSERWAIAPDFTYFFSNTTEEKVESLLGTRTRITGRPAALELNINGRYYFYDNDNTFKMSLLTGLNHTRYLGGGNVHEFTLAGLGLTTVSLGVGGHFRLNDALELFSDLRHVFSLLGGTSLTIGIKHSF